jgi:hypothetical protein
MTGHDSKDRTVGTGELGIRAMEKNSWAWQGVDGTGQADRTARGGSRDNTAKNGDRGQDGQNMTG